MDHTIKAQPFDCMQFFFGEVQEPRMRCLIRFENGQIDTKRLEAAVDELLTRHPLLKSTFVASNRSWKLKNFTAKNVIIETAESPNLVKSSRRLLLSSIHPEDEPQIKVFIVRSKTESALCIIINHMICDGSAFKELLYQLSDFYSGKQSSALTEKDRSLHAVSRNLGLIKKLNIVFSRQKMIKQTAKQMFPLKPGAKTPYMAVRKLSKQQLASLKAYAKERGASINDMFMTAYALALQEKLGITDFTIPCPVDLRKYAEPGFKGALSNLTSNYRCSIAFETDDCFDSVLGRIAVQMNEQKKKDECLKGPVVYHMLFHMLPFWAIRMMLQHIAPIPATTYTNPGIIDQKRLRFGNLQVSDAYMCAAVKKAPYFQIAFSTFNDTCTVSISAYAHKPDQEAIEIFLDRVTTFLLAPIGEKPPLREEQDIEAMPTVDYTEESVFDQLCADIENEQAGSVRVTNTESL